MFLAENFFSDGSTKGKEASNAPICEQSLRLTAPQGKNE
jgi:hypothetical protein